MESTFNYTDESGRIIGTYTNDGSEIYVTLLEHKFKGSEFSDLEPIKDSILPDRFTLQHNCLCNCEFIFTIPIRLSSKGQILETFLNVIAKLGKPDERGGIDCETYKLSLNYQNNFIQSSGISGWFEDELLELQAQLPDDIFIKSCINCQFSDYSPAGYGAFGSMMCFKNLKSEYQKVKSKQDFWSIHDKHSGFVQETFLCEEFERRLPGSGYRG